MALELDKTDFLRKLVAALRSGKYKRCDGQLRDGEDGDYSYCCLGVAAELAGLEFINLTADPDAKVTDRATQVRTVDGVVPQLKSVISGHEQEILYGKNDDRDSTGYKYSWDDIADYIEEELI